MWYIKLVLKKSKGVQWQKQGGDFREETELDLNPKMTFLQRQSREEGIAALSTGK